MQCRVARKGCNSLAFLAKEKHAVGVCTHRSGGPRHPKVLHRLRDAHDPRAVFAKRAAGPLDKDAGLARQKPPGLVNDDEFLFASRTRTDFLQNAHDADEKHGALKDRFVGQGLHLEHDERGLEIDIGLAFKP